MILIDKLKAALFVILLASLEASVAAGNNRVIFSPASAFKDSEHRAILLVRESSFLNKPTWDYTKNEWPPLSMFHAAKQAILWADQNHPGYSWKLRSVSLKFYNVIKGSCIYIVVLRSDNRELKYSSFLNIGVDLTGELIIPKIKKKVFERKDLRKYWREKLKIKN